MSKLTLVDQVLSEQDVEKVSGAFCMSITTHCEEPAGGGLLSNTSQTVVVPDDTDWVGNCNGGPGV